MAWPHRELGHCITAHADYISFLSFLSFHPTQTRCHTLVHILERATCAFVYSIRLPSFPRAYSNPFVHLPLSSLQQPVISNIVE